VARRFSLRTVFAASDFPRLVHRHRLHATLSRLCRVLTKSPPAEAVASHSAAAVTATPAEGSRVQELIHAVTTETQ
jgi:hypothetical protein